ncbi:Holliday junction branch migration protein RuvA [Gephyromycinifex aptenodytis]|uniref:Holliday junction branch migration protein RuvA n=1 Tax=Gephyromycinifex aptenodytis TaxID=2716227 RepID=UPI0014479444|nr:Holliday junction branch migration protein RuvA [Gephyromycinifex aptenodytis]
MIASVEGTVLDVGLDRVVVQLGGVGVLVHTTPGTAAAQRLGSQTMLATSLVVREDSLTLYGFASADERSVFEIVQTVSGVGPRLALAMLAVLSPGEVAAAVSGGDIAVLTRVPGIGKKGAERLVLELRDKLLGLADSPGQSPTNIETPAAQGPWRDQVRDALVGLGWNAKQAETGIEAVLSRGEVVSGVGGPDVPTLLKAALRELGR